MQHTAYNYDTCNMSARPLLANLELSHEVVSGEVEHLIEVMSLLYKVCVAWRGMCKNAESQLLVVSLLFAR